MEGLDKMHDYLTLQDILEDKLAPEINLVPQSNIDADTPFQALYILEVNDEFIP